MKRSDQRSLGLPVLLLILGLSWTRLVTGQAPNPESLRLGPLPGDLASIWVNQGIDDPRTETKASSGTTLPMKDPGLRMVQWDNSPRGLSNEWRITLLEMAERHENEARTDTNAVMHRMIALQSLAEFAERFPRDRLLPEVLLHQALLARDSGMPVFALDKLYSVLRALPLSGSTDLRYLRRLTLITQGSIADLHAEIGKLPEAADLYGRLVDSGMRQEPPGIITLKRIRLLESAGNDVLLANTAKALLKQSLRPPEESEARGRLALASLRNGDLDEARRQMQIVLEAHRRAPTAERPVWETWRLVLGNAAANHLFKQGMYSEARVIYESIAEEVQDPVWRWQAHGMVARCEESLEQLGAAKTTLLRRLEYRSEALFPVLNGVTDPTGNTMRKVAEFHAASVGRLVTLETELAKAVEDNSKASSP